MENIIDTSMTPVRQALVEHLMILSDATKKIPELDGAAAVLHALTGAVLAHQERKFAIDITPVIEELRDLVRAKLAKHEEKLSAESELDFFDKNELIS